jgi:hypothetical protein
MVDGEEESVISKPPKKIDSTWNSRGTQIVLLEHV